MAFIDVAMCIAVAMCNVVEASQNAYLVLIFYYYPCLQRSDQSYIRFTRHHVPSISLLWGEELHNPCHQRSPFG